MKIPPEIRPQVWRHPTNGIAWFSAAHPVVPSRFENHSFDEVSRWVEWFRAFSRAHPFNNTSDEWPYVLAYRSSWRRAFEEAIELSEEGIRATIEVLPEPEICRDGQVCQPVHTVFLLALALKTDPRSASRWQLVKETFDAHPFSK